jgi:hypothetical protein
MMIPTPQSLHRQNCRLDARLARAEEVLFAMRGGAVLHLQYLHGKPDWWLSRGQHVEPDVAAAVIANPQVVAVGTALFDGLLGQAFRFALPPK